MLLWVEFALTLLAPVFAVLFSKQRWKWVARIEKAFRQIGEHRVASVFLVGMLALGARLAILPLQPLPYPTINDEFSFLLAADTFSHGRLTNPPHPMGVHFENLHEIQRPTYASMYPPAQGMFLALGQRLTGRPFAGVCIVVALFCAAVCWMLQGWTSPGLALFGGMLAVIRFGMFSYWANTYWGGAAAALGAALVLGAVPRIRKSPAPAGAIALALGLAILANSRPYEGLVFSIPVAVWLLVWFFRKTGNERRMAMLGVMLPLLVALLMAAMATGYYFWRVTGNPLLMPQLLDRQTYAVAPYFLWQSPGAEPAYHHPFLRSFYVGTELAFYQSNRSVTAIVALTIVKLIDVWLFYLGPLLSLPLIVMSFAGAKKMSWENISADTRFLLVVAACLLAGLACEVFFFPHYAAPIACVLLALVLRAVGKLRSWQWRGRPAGLVLSRIFGSLCVLLLALRCASVPLHLEVTSDWPPSWYNSIPLKSRRAEILTQLQQYPGKQLVLVRYGNVSLTRNQWVYNEADVDASRVVWAWDMGDARNRELLDYFRDRHVWHLDPDKEGAELSPY